MARQYPPDPLEFARLLNTNRRQRRHEPLLTLTRLLKTDSKLEFASIRDALSCAAKPRNAVQEVYFQEVVYFVWEFLHLQRCRAKMFNSERRPALEELLRALHFSELGFELVPTGNEARNFVRELPGGSNVPKRLSHLLKRVQMEDSVIDRGEIRPSATPRNPRCNPTRPRGGRGRVHRRERGRAGCPPATGEKARVAKGRHLRTADVKHNGPQGRALPATPRNGITCAELSRRIGWKRESVDRDPQRPHGGRDRRG
jgi:hypothetical protein